MRIVEWNCRMALHRKLFLLEELGSDVAVVPECAEGVGDLLSEGTTFAWKGHNPKKGLGVIGFNGWCVQPLDGGPEQPWVLPVRVSHGGEWFFDLLAVWTVMHKEVSELPYAAQIAGLIEAWGPILADGSTVVAGDFNTSIQGPSSGPHRSNLERLAELGVTSAYHHALGVDHGDEPDRTLRWIGPGRTEYRYVCDFVFVPDRMLPGIDARVKPIWDGDHAGLSDHQPVVVDLNHQSVS